MINIGQAFSAWALLTFGAGTFFTARNWLVHCRLFSSVHTFHWLDIKSTTWAVTKKNVSRQCQMFWGSNNPRLRTTILETHLAVQGYQKWRIANCLITEWRSIFWERNQCSIFFIPLNFEARESYSITMGQKFSFPLLHSNARTQMNLKKALKIAKGRHLLARLKLSSQNISLNWS